MSTTEVAIWAPTGIDKLVLQTLWGTGVAFFGESNLPSNPQGFAIGLRIGIKLGFG